MDALDDELRLTRGDEISHIGTGFPFLIRFQKK